MLRPLTYPLLSVLLALAGCGAAGELPAVSEAAAGTLRIGAVQGSGARSPKLGQRIEVQGVVTGNFVSGLDGFFLQDAAGEEDGDVATADGVFVHWPRGTAPKVRRGDRVRVAGTVAERGTGDDIQTTIEATDVAPLGRGAAAVTTLAAAPADGTQWERYEGMWLRISAPLTVSGNDALLRWGELQVSFDGRQVQPTEKHPPGPQAHVAEADNRRRRLTLDDTRRGDFPERLWFLPEGLSPERPLRTGSVLHAVEGVLEQRYGWRLQLTAKLGRIEHAPRPAPPKLPDGLRIASYNVLNFFNGNGRGRGFPTLRGATTAEELIRQRDKIVVAISALEPDIAALMELENDGYGDHSSLVELVEALNAALGEDHYRYIGSGGQGPGRDEIRVGLIYRPDRVTPRGAPALLESGPFLAHSRVPLAQAFATPDGDHTFTVVANHFKSKGSCEEAVEAGDRDQQDGQGCWNATRVASARALSDWLATAPDGQDGKRVLLVGDLNAYGQEDPMRILRAAGWRDAFEVAGTKNPYSYVFNGLSGRLDHALASAALAPFVRTAREWHINADESEAFDYNREERAPEWYRPDAYRASDHDPLVVVLDFDRR